MKTPSFKRSALFLLPAIVVAAAMLITCRPAEKPSLATFDAIAEPIVSPGWITFKDSAKVDPNTLFKDYADLFRLPPGNDMVLNRLERDEEGLTLFRYSQFYKGIEVENAEFLVHARSNRAISANGELEFDFQPAVTQPALGEENALQVLRAHIPDTRFFREDRLAQDVKTTSPDDVPPYFPKGKLLYTEHPETGERVLVWMFRAYTQPLEKSRQVYIDAGTGKVIKEQILLPECFAAGGNTTFRGFQNFNTARADIPDFGERFILMDDCHGCRLHMLSWNTGSSTREIFDSDNNWNESNNLPFVTSFWALGIAYDYFDLIHGRKSWDNKNGDMTIINDPTLGNNANGGGGVINIGLGPTNLAIDDYNTTDIIGHEFTHSVVETSAKLGYDASKESAALNESFSDIFGQMVERWDEQNANPDWVIGDAKGCSGSLLCRDLKNPKTYNHPDTYKGRFWQTASIDPHVNGGVQNRWFVLLADGGSGTSSELGTQYNLTGIGIAKARRIAYRTLTRYLTAASDYADARDGSIQAARDLYGPDAIEVGDVTKAWCAVGLCPYSVPKLADIFDRPGGNPNPASPNNNSFGGATPLGTGAYPWTADAKPRLTTPQLSIYPLNDVDYFRIEFPQVNLLGGRCFAPGVSFQFGTEVNARIILDGKVFKSFRNVPYFSMAFPETRNRDFVLEVAAAFPGQILDYKLAISFYQRIISDCFQTIPPDKWELIRNCPVCDFSILSEINQVILDPFYRRKDGVGVTDYFFYKRGEGGFEIPINIREGNALRVELVDESGKVVSTAVREGNAATLRLRSAAAKEGVYSLRFNGYGNGTEIEIRTPMMR